MIVVTVARRPLSAPTVVGNVLAHGTGALNIDESRVRSAGGEVIGPGSWSDPTKREGEVGGDLGFTGNDVAKFQQAQAESVERANRLGRWPANLVLGHRAGCRLAGTREVSGDGHWPSSRPRGSDVSGPSGHTGQAGLEERNASCERVAVWACVPGCPVADLDAQSGESKSASGTLSYTRADTSGWKERGGSFTPGREWEAEGYGDTGGASRYFKQVGGQKG